MNIGEAEVNVIGVGNYTGVSSMTFKINPGNVVLGKVKPAKKKLTIKWKGLSGGVSYQVQYRIGKGKWKTKIAKKPKLTIKKLKSKKKCSVRVRAFKNVKGEKYYGA